MKKTTRNYIAVLLANLLLIAMVAVVWQVRLEAATPVKPVLRGDFADMDVKAEPVRMPAATYLKGLEKQADIADFKGKWTILNMWATWCGPCIVELPSLQKLADTYKGRGLDVVAISMDEAASVADLEEAIARTKLSKIAIARNWDDKGAIADVLWPESLPTTYVIDPQGRLFASIVGEIDWSSPDAAAFVNSLIGNADLTGI